MGYFWLNQRDEQENSGYSDIEGEVYHYRGNIPGSRLLSVGDRFVYYRPGEYVIFGGGIIDDIEEGENQIEWNNPISSELQNNVQRKVTITDYYAHIRKYREFSPPVSVRSIKEDISFLKDRNGLSGVPQNSIHQIDEADFRTILKAADALSLMDEN